MNAGAGLGNLAAQHLLRKVKSHGHSASSMVLQFEMMDSLSFESIATARPLSFKVGTNKREFFMHSSLVGSLSPPLNQLANGPWSESADAIVEWEHVDEATFVHFCQFAYTGTYRVESTPSIMADSATTPTTPDADVDAAKQELQPPPDPGVVDWDTFRPMSKKAKKKKRSTSSIFGPRGIIEEEENFPEHFQSVFQQVLVDKGPTNRRLSNPIQAAPSEVTKCSSYSDIFLAHARLYIFADCYQIDNLANDALDNLHKALTTNQVQDSDVVDIIEFYVTTKDVPDTLGEVMLAYIASKANAVWGNQRFQELLQQDSEMMFKLLDLIMKAAMVEEPTPPGQD